MAKTTLTRRQFIGGAAGLQLSLYLSGAERGLFRLLTGAEGMAPETVLAQGEAGFGLGAFIQIDAEGWVTILAPKPDIGQGTRTSFAMLVAEDLEADWARVRVLQAPAGAQFGNQGIGGSNSIRSSWRAMRSAGATGRAMLVAAAAEQWGVPAAECVAALSVVRHPASGRELGYGALAEAAAGQTPPAEVELKPWAACTLVGQPTDRVDNVDVVRGRAGYGMDQRVPGMLYAVIARPPVYGARLLAHDADAARALPGVRAVVADISGGVAVVAEHTWAALRGRDALAAQWDMGANVTLTGAAIRERLSEAAAGLPGLPASVRTPVEISFDLPYLAHAMMEPLNCLAESRADGCEVWAATQNPQSVQRSVARALGLADAAVVVHTTLSGGGFGRRIDNSAAVEAALVSRAVGAPVQVLWSREDDLRQAAFRPASHHALRGGLDADGRPVAWAHRMGISGRSQGGFGFDAADTHLARLEGVDGTDQQDTTYDIPGYGVDTITVGTPVPTTFWRSVNHSQTIFANECFVDMLAAAADRDPYVFRREHLTDARMRDVLDKVAEVSGWGEPLPAGRAKGIACFDGYGSCIAHVVELSVTPSGRVTVHKIWAAVDPGVAINPRGVVAQVEGAAIDGLSTALKAEITIVGGAVQESSYYDYQWLRIDEAPPTEVHIVTGRSSTPGGMGEVGYPSVGPAVANAIFAATGRRVTRLPIRPVDLAGWRDAVAPVPGPVTPEPTPVDPSPTAVPPTAAPPDRVADRIYLPHLKRDGR